jgi:hypothetical protein
VLFRRRRLSVGSKQGDVRPCRPSSCRSPCGAAKGPSGKLITMISTCPHPERCHPEHSEGSAVVFGNVSAHDKFVEKLRYMHRNPVHRGLVAKPEHWRWSSYRHYQTGMRSTVEIESAWTARYRGWQLPEGMRYQHFGAASPVPRFWGPGMAPQALIHA